MTHLFSDSNNLTITGLLTWRPTDSVTHLITDSLTHWTISLLTHWITDYFFYWLTDSLTHWLTDSLTPKKFTYSMTHWLFYTLIHQFTDSLTNWLFDSMHWLTDMDHSFTWSHIHSLRFMLMSWIVKQSPFFPRTHRILGKYSLWIFRS